MKKLFITSSIVFLAFLYAGVAIAFTGPPGAPTGCPTGYTGCDQPLNVSATNQAKNGYSLSGLSSGVGALGVPVVFTNWLNLTGGGASLGFPTSGSAPSATNNQLYEVGSTLY